MQNLPYLAISSIHCHWILVPFHSKDCSSEITGITNFHGRSEIFAGKFYWNGTRICRNDQNLARICGASLRPLQWTATDFQQTVHWVHQKWQGLMKVCQRPLDKQWECKILLSCCKEQPCGSIYIYTNNFFPRMPSIVGK